MSNEAVEAKEVRIKDDPRRPTVKLVGYDGNAFAIMGRVSSALRRAGYSGDEVEEYTKQATSGDYNNLLLVSCMWADVPTDCDDYEDEEDYE